MRYEDAVDELYQSPHDAFVAERRRLASELKASGDADGAARLAKLARPTASAWAVDQLWWHARDVFDTMFVTAARLRSGDFRSMPAHREAIAQLRARATQILENAGHTASEVVLRRVTTTLAALAAEGGFGADRPGTLAVDRESPGFGTGGGTSAPGGLAPMTGPAPAVARSATQDYDRVAREREREEALAAQRRADEEAKAAAAAAAEAERRAREQEAARRAAERARIEKELVDAKGELTIAEKDVKHFEAELADARLVADRARARVSELTVKLAADWGTGT